MQSITEKLVSQVRLSNAFYLASVRSPNIFVKDDAKMIASQYLPNYALSLASHALSLLLCLASAYPIMQREYGIQQLLTLEQFVITNLVQDFENTLSVQGIATTDLLVHDFSLWASTFSSLALQYAKHSKWINSLEALWNSSQSGFAASELVISAVSFAEIAKAIQNDSIVKSIVLESSTSLAKLLVT